MANHEGSREQIEAALNELREHADDSGDGRWFELLVKRVAPLIPGWEISAVSEWDEWLERESVLEASVSDEDNGIDFVARRNDGRWVPIQAKAYAGGSKLAARPVDSFLAATLGNDVWAERWIVTTTDSNRHLRDKLLGLPGEHTPVRVRLIEEDLGRALDYWRVQGAGPDPRETMQDDAVRLAVEGLDSIRGAKHRGWRSDEARGKVIMPCGTGKSRVGYRIAATVCSRATGVGLPLVVVLAPSIGLIRQLREQWVVLADERGDCLQTLSVCSEPVLRSTKQEKLFAEQATVAASATEVAVSDDPTVDLSGLSAVNLVGETARSAARVEDWLKQRRDGNDAPPELRLVIFSTYQSSHHTAAGMRAAAMEAEILIADEAHRTAGLKATGTRDAEQVKDFTVCHRNDAMPARNRVYMTATPRAFARGTGSANKKYDVLSMDDEAIFGCELYRLSYAEAVTKKFLSDYRIIAVVPPESGRDLARKMALRTKSRVEGETRPKPPKPRKGARGNGKASAARSTASPARDTESLALRKLAYGMAIAGGVEEPNGNMRAIRSSIAFCNRITHSADLAEDLSHADVREWLRNEVVRHGGSGTECYELLHRDAASAMQDREAALNRLRTSTEDEPVGVTNVGIFGEGIDTPALDAVAFIESRKSPVDVIQAVGRAMRLSPEKEFGYIIVPLEIPPGKDPEAWLESRENDDGYKELAQILVALRAHDGRIEDSLAQMLRIHVPDDEEEHEHLVTVATPNGFEHALVTCPHGGVEHALASRTSRLSALDLLRESATVRLVNDGTTVNERPAAAFVVDGRRRKNIRFAPIDVDARFPAGGDGTPFKLKPATVQMERQLDEAIADTRTNRLRLRKPYRRRPPRNKGDGPGPHEGRPSQMRLLTELTERSERGDGLRVRVLENSGLCGGTRRDLNLLREIVETAAAKLRADNLEDTLSSVLRMEKWRETGKKRADGCTVTALLLTTAVLVQARIEKSSAIQLPERHHVARIAASGEAAKDLMVAFDRVMDVDYKPVFGLARDLLRHLTFEVRRTVNLDDAVRGIAANARDVAESYAQMGADYAGELFNEVMGDQASDGAYFTRPVAGTLLAGLALEASGASDAESLTQLRVLDPACGSGTLLTAWLHEAKRKAGFADTTNPEDKDAARFHRKLVENSLMGLDVNATSLQLAGAQMVIGDPKARYDKMRLHRMRYADPDSGTVPPAGSLELLAEDEILQRLPVTASRQGELLAPSDATTSADEEQQNGGRTNCVVDEDLVEKVVDADVVLTNPPFVTRDKLGLKFGEQMQAHLRRRIDRLQELVEARNPGWIDFCAGQTTGPLYVMLGLLCIHPDTGILGTVIPTAGLLAPSGLKERQVLAAELQIRWIVTCHEPGQTNLSQSSIAESLVIGTREGRGEDASTTFVSLARFPRDTEEAQAVIDAITARESAPGIAFRDVSASRMRSGDWSAAGWCNTDLDEAAEWIDAHRGLVGLADLQGISLSAPGHGSLTHAEPGCEHLAAYIGKGGDAQDTLEGQPQPACVNQYGEYVRTENDTKIYRRRELKGEEQDALARRLAGWEKHRGKLLITAGQRMESARVTAVVDGSVAGGIGATWKPVQGMDESTAKAWAVYLNSTLGRIEIMRHRGKDLQFAIWRSRGLQRIQGPDPTESSQISVLAACYEATKRIRVDRYDAGQVPVRIAWDDAVAKAVGIDRERLRKFARMLNDEPVVSKERFRARLRTVGSDRGW